MDEYFFKNADSDEILFIHKGSGCCKSMYGTVDFKYGDYVVIPRGTVYKLEFETKSSMLRYFGYKNVRTKVKINEMYNYGYLKGFTIYIL